MILPTIIKVHERRVRRGTAKQFNRSSKAAWVETAKLFHNTLRDRRFTPGHAKRAGYTKRRGESMSPDDKGYWRQYYGRKLRNPKWGGGAGRADPLVKTGEAKMLSKSMRPVATSAGGKGGVKIRYPGLRKFNYKNPRSSVDMAAEFRRILTAEREAIVQHYDRNLDENLKQGQ